MRKVIVYIATSLDGYIATEDDDLSFLSIVEKEGEDYGYTSFMAEIDTVVLGNKTYQTVLDMGHLPHTDKECYVYTRTPRPTTRSPYFYTQPLPTLIAELKQRAGKDIFIDGGAHTIHALLLADLIDEFYISIIPILLGSGITLFKNGRTDLPLQLVSAKSFDTGLVQLRYRRY